MPDPYINKLLDADLPCTDKSPVKGKLVCILHARAEQRGLELCPYPSRAVLKNEIHELILTAEAQAAPAQKVNRISYLGYFEVMEGGVLWTGDQVNLNGQLIGILAGYDLTHFPNHMNIVIKVQEPLYTGWEIDLLVGAPIEFIFTQKKSQPGSNLVK